MFAPKPRIPGQFVTQLKPMLLQKSPGQRQRHGPLVSSAFLTYLPSQYCVRVRGVGEAAADIANGLMGFALSCLV